MPSPQFFLLLALKMASLGAFWVVYFYNLSACLPPALTSCQFVSLILTNRMSDSFSELYVSDSSVILPCSQTLGLYACIFGAFEELAKLACLLA